MRRYAPLFVPQLVAFTLVFGGVQAAEAGAFGDSWRPGAGGIEILWGDSVHRTPDELATWLGDRGRTYEVWAKRHPQAAVDLQRAAIAEARTQTTETVLPLETSTLVLLMLVLSSVSLIAVTSAGGVKERAPRLWRQRRMRYVYWPAGVASAVLLGLLVAQVI